MERAFPAAVIFEDDDLLIVNKPSGISTHTPDKDLCWGWYEYFHWLNADVKKLKLLHRLDRETSGVLLFAKSSVASQALAGQWESGSVLKRYVFATRQKPKKNTWQSDRLIDGQKASTEFRVLSSGGAFHLIEAMPKTGRTHQVRIHASDSGVPIVGDREHGDSRDNWPLLLHAAELRCRPPRATTDAVFSAPVPETFSANSAQAAWFCRAGLLREAMTEKMGAVRWIHGVADGFSGQVVERFNDVWVLSIFGEVREDELKKALSGKKLVIKRYLGQGRVENAGQVPPVNVVENGLRYEIRFDEATTTGLYLDQRENRLWLKRILPSLPPGPVLNCFAHTCSFSVVAASTGRATASLDLSTKYLEWGKSNFVLNGLDPEKHRWLKGDTADWIKRLKKKNEKFAAIILDPPSFSRGKMGAFSVEKDLEPLIHESLSLLLPGGAMLVATNFQKWSREDFMARVEKGLRGKKAKLKQIPLPPDFPYASGEPLWMKSAWVTLEK